MEPRDLSKLNKDLNRRLIEAFPELTSLYHEEVNWQEGDETGCHVVYGDVFSPYLERALREKQKDQLERGFAFIEELLNINDVYIDEVIVLSVLGFIIDSSDYMCFAKQYFGPQTQEKVHVFLTYRDRKSDTGRKSE